MYVTPDDLRVHLRLPDEDFDAVAAVLAIESVSSMVSAVVGAERFDEYITDPDAHAFGVARAIILAHAGRRYTNPESVLQRRLGSDYSVSFSDSSEAARGLSRQEQRLLKDAFGRPRFAAVTMTSMPAVTPWPELPLE